MLTLFGGLNMDLINQNKAPTDSAKHYQTLHLFAYGTWSDYAKNKAKYIDLNPKMIKKLKILTLVQLCLSSPQLSYDEIANACDLSKGQLVEEVEQLVLQCYSNQLIECRIDQKNKQVLVLLRI